MGQRQNANTRDVQIKSSKEDYASSMGQRSNDAALKGAPNQAGRSVHQTWSNMDKEKMQQRRMHKLCCEKRSVQKARSKSQIMQYRRMHKKIRTRRIMQATRYMILN
jgi:hypothetical protein